MTSITLLAPAIDLSNRASLCGETSARCGWPFRADLSGVEQYGNHSFPVKALFPGFLRTRGCVMGWLRSLLTIGARGCMRVGGVSTPGFMAPWLNHFKRFT